MQLVSLLSLEFSSIFVGLYQATQGRVSTRMCPTSWYIVKLQHNDQRPFLPLLQKAQRLLEQAFHLQFSSPHILVLIICLFLDLGLLSFSHWLTMSQLLSKEDKNSAEGHTALDRDLRFLGLP